MLTPKTASTLALVARGAPGGVSFCPLRPGAGGCTACPPAAHQRASHLGNTAFSKPLVLPILLQNTQLPFYVLRRRVRGGL